MKVHEDVPDCVKRVLRSFRGNHSATEDPKLRNPGPIAEETVRRLRAEREAKTKAAKPKPKPSQKNTLLRYFASAAPPSDQAAEEAEAQEAADAAEEQAPAAVPASNELREADYASEGIPLGQRPEIPPAAAYLRKCLQCRQAMFTPFSRYANFHVKGLGYSCGTGLQFFSKPVVLVEGHLWVIQ